MTLLPGANDRAQNFARTRATEATSSLHPGASVIPQRTRMSQRLSATNLKNMMKDKGVREAVGMATAEYAAIGIETVVGNAVNGYAGDAAREAFRFCVKKLCGRKYAPERSNNREALINVRNAIRNKGENKAQKIGAAAFESTALVADVASGLLPNWMGTLVGTATRGVVGMVAAKKGIEIQRPTGQVMASHAKNCISAIRNFNQTLAWPEGHAAENQIRMNMKDVPKMMNVGARMAGESQYAANAPSFAQDKQSAAQQEAQQYAMIRRQVITRGGARASLAL